MRIIGGEYRSRLISMPKGADIRPTQDRVREAVFNLLGDISGARVLDLFAGSGAFGIEAISRGAGYATFVDNNFRCFQTINDNVEAIDINTTIYDIIRSNALSVLPRLERNGKKYNLIFMDPPYYKGMAKKCLINIDSCDILARNGLIVTEHSKKDSLDAGLKTILVEKERRYGDTVITIFRRCI